MHSYATLLAAFDVEDFEDLDLESGDGSRGVGTDDLGTGDYTEVLDDFSMFDLDQPEENGDRSDTYEEYYNDPNGNVMPSLNSSDNSRQCPEYWQDDLTWEEEAESDMECYVPINKLLANEDHERNEWYDSPDDEEFRAAFACLNSRKNLAKKYLLEMLNPCEEEGHLCTLDELEPRTSQQVSFALSEMHIPRLARISVEKLSDLLIEHPSLDLRKFLVGLDVFTIAYVIWGIDFYMNRKCLNIGDEDGRTHLEGRIGEDSSRLSEALKDTWSRSLCWISSTLSSLISNSGQGK